MICPTCQTVTSERATACPVCEQPLSAATDAAHEHGMPTARPVRRVRVVEGSISASTTIPLRQGDILSDPPDATPDASEQSATNGETLPVPVSSHPTNALVPLLRALPPLAAKAWEQPAVRAAVRTGASAVAVSVATRVATRLVTRWLAGENATSVVQPRALDMLPLLSDALGEHASPPTARRRHGHSATVETFIYMRRTITTD